MKECCFVFYASGRHGIRKGTREKKIPVPHRSAVGPVSLWRTDNNQEGKSREKVRKERKTNRRIAITSGCHMLWPLEEAPTAKSLKKKDEITP